MVHLICLRCANSMTEHPEAQYGVHEQVERNINRRRYSVQSKREGYTIPFSAQWRFMDYRLKKDAVADFAVDLGGMNLNPTPNTITLWQIFSKRTKLNNHRTVGKLFALCIWTMKWVNRKRVTTPLLTVTGILTLSPFLIILAALIWYNPIRPIPISSKEPERFSPYWNYNFLIGTIRDDTVKQRDGTVMEDVL